MHQMESKSGSCILCPERGRANNEPDRWCSVFSSPDYGPDGKLASITGVTMDISAQVKVEQYERHRAEEAIELRRAQEGFIDTVS